MPSSHPYNNVYSQDNREYQDNRLREEMKAVTFDDGLYAKPYQGLEEVFL